MWGLGTPEDLNYFIKYQGSQTSETSEPNPNE